MNKHPPIRFTVPLILLLSSSGPARAHEPEASPLRAQWEQCLQAQTLLQCRAALPTCNAVLKSLDGLPSEPQIERHASGY